MSRILILMGLLSITLCSGLTFAQTDDPIKDYISRFGLRRDNQIKCFMLDVNRDGKDDLLISDDTDTAFNGNAGGFMWVVYLSTGNGFQRSPTFLDFWYQNTMTRKYPDGRGSRLFFIYNQGKGPPMSLGVFECVLTDTNEFREDKICNITFEDDAAPDTIFDLLQGPQPRPHLITLTVADAEAAGTKSLLVRSPKADSLETKPEPRATE